MGGDQQQRGGACLGECVDLGGCRDEVLGQDGQVDGGDDGPQVTTLMPATPAEAMSRAYAAGSRPASRSPSFGERAFTSLITG